MGELFAEVIGALRTFIEAASMQLYHSDRLFGAIFGTGAPTDLPHG